MRGDAILPAMSYRLTSELLQEYDNSGLCEILKIIHIFLMIVAIVTKLSQSIYIIASSKRPGAGCITKL